MEVEALCRAMGLEVVTQDPYNLAGTTQAIYDLLQEDGVRVLILRRECALVRAKSQPAAFRVRVEPDLCLGLACGCRRLCTRVFKCPGLTWDPVAEQARIDEAICTGCGVCAQICPSGAIIAEAV
ncbi:MAG: 4Fe-4S binding protein [Deltaproteobacteria bacterium]|nr:4Fe-4S binding protein [Deltaproteobacteria bacterium]